MRVGGTDRYLLAACVTRYAVTRPHDLHDLGDLVLSLASGLSAHHVDVLLEDCAEAAGRCIGEYSLVSRGPQGQRVDRDEVRARARRAPKALNDLTTALLALELPVPDQPSQRGDEHIADWHPSAAALEQALIAAAGYAIGRRSYIVGTVAQWLRSWSPSMSPSMAATLLGMLDTEPLGDPQDVDTWRRIREHLLSATTGSPSA